LGSSVNSETLLTKRHPRSILKKRRRREFAELRLFDDQSDAGIPARNGMADPVAFHRIKKEHLVRFGNCLVLPDVSDVYAAVGEYELRR
jgi:hypothetical protein